MLLVLADRETAEAVRRFVDAFNAEDLDAFIRTYAEDIGPLNGAKVVAKFRNLETGSTRSGGSRLARRCTTVPQSVET